jgi:hypothetical protein
MNREKIRIVFMVALVAITTVVNAEVDKLELVGKDVHTSFSGYDGAENTLGVDGHYQGLHSIVWGEKTDDPCGMYIVTQHINNGTSVMLQNDLPKHDRVSKYVFGEFTIKENTYRPYVDYSSGSPVTRFVEEVKLDCNGNRKLVSAIKNFNYVYKINVCTTDKKNTYDNKLKGVRFWTRELVYRNYKDGEDPILITQPTPQEAIHAPHCDKWHTPVQCDAGEIATRLVVAHNDFGHRDWITGLALYCKKVRVKKPPKKPMNNPKPNEFPHKSPVLKNPGAGK